MLKTRKILIKVIKKFYKVIYIMKYRKYLELSLIILLVALMYQKSNFLNNLVSNPLAKLLLLGVVVSIARIYGRNAGIISALIVILLFHNLFEGNQNMSDNKENDENSDDNTDNDSDSDSTKDNSDDDEETSNNKSKVQPASEDEETGANELTDEAGVVSQKMISTTDKTDLEEQMRPTNSNEEEALPDNTNTTNEHEPLAMPSSTKEGFSLLN